MLRHHHSSIKTPNIELNVWATGFHMFYMQQLFNDMNTNTVALPAAVIVVSDQLFRQSEISGTLMNISAL